MQNNQVIIPATGSGPTVLHQEVVLGPQPQANRPGTPAPQSTIRASAPNSVPVRAAGPMPMPRAPAGRFPRSQFRGPPIAQMPSPFLSMGPMMGLAVPPMLPNAPVPQPPANVPLSQMLASAGFPGGGQSNAQLSTLDPYLACTARQWTRDYEEADEEPQDGADAVAEGSISGTEQQQQQQRRARSSGRIPRPPRQQQQQSEVPMNAITITIPNVAVNAQLGFGSNGAGAPDAGIPGSPGGFPMPGPGLFPPGAPIPPGSLPNPMQMIQQMMPMLMAGMQGAGVPRAPAPGATPRPGFLPPGLLLPGLFGPAAAAGPGGMPAMPTMGQMLAAMGVRIPSGSEAEASFEQLLMTITSRLSVMDNMALIMGDFRPLNSMQAVIRDHLTRSLFNNDPNAGLDPERQTRAAQQLMDTLGQMDMTAGLQANPNNARGAIDLKATYRQIEQSLLIRFIRTTYSDSDRSFGERIRDALADFRFELQLVSNNCIVGGYDAFLNNLEQILVCPLFIFTVFILCS